ncbi:Sperm-tail_PG-rich repeat [Hexamita inflata]|uniref:Sperm-tail PG-rich repeat n=1 Tax=Hexamita inflata TaxID=28002 RepID=A0AA86UXF5_9EUKA|nr:Sperm-tail PG-rich repeat [Hexamita inflata]
MSGYKLYNNNKKEEPVVQLKSLNKFRSKHIHTSLSNSTNNSFCTPGPGEYDIKLDFVRAKSNASFSRAGRDSQKIMQIPGPGDYQIEPKKDEFIKKSTLYRKDRFDDPEKSMKEYMARLRQGEKYNATLGPLSYKVNFARLGKLKQPADLKMNSSERFRPNLSEKYKIWFTDY